MVNLYIVYLFISFTLLLNVKTFLSVLKSFSSREKYLYIYLFLSVIGWIMCNAGADIIKNPQIAEFFARASILFPINILNALLQIFRHFPKTIYKPQKYAIFDALNYITWVFTLVCAVLLYSDINIANFEVSLDGPADFVPGFAYYIVFVIALFIFLYITNFWRKNFSSYTKTQKRQIYSLFGTLLFVYFSMTFGLLILPLQGLTIYSPFMFLSLSLLLFVINKSLWIKIAVLDIQEELVKLGGLLITTIILVLSVSMTNIVEIDFNWIGRFLAGFLVISAITFMNNTFRDFYETKRRYLQYQVTKFVESSTTKLSVSEISTDLKKTLSLILKTKDINIKIINGKNESNIDRMVEQWWFLRKRTPIINKEVLIESYFDKENNRELSKEIFSNLQSENIDMVIPISNQKNVVGLIYIKNSPKILNETDYKALELLSNSLSVSISRALIYEEVEKLNNSLQQKVDYQTKELQLKVKQLQEARRKESDMIDIMGHELRTPATVIKLNVDFLQKFSEHLPKNKEDFLKYVSRIKDAIDTEIRLINTLLTSAKLEGDKIEINAEKVDFTKEIEMALHAEEHLAQDKGLKLVNNIPKDIPPVYADHARVSEIFNNLISNAVRYTDKGSVVVDAIEENKYIKISIKDTGKGISRKDVARLGTKFFRTKTYIKSQNGDNFNIVRPGGTGLGLYVSFGLVEKMGGRIEVKSEINNGSTFSVYLPKYRSQDGHKQQEGTKDMFTKLGLK